MNRAGGVADPFYTTTAVVTPRAAVPDWPRRSLAPRQDPRFWSGSPPAAMGATTPATPYSSSPPAGLPPIDGGCGCA